MANLALEVQERALTGKGAAHALRAQGFVPGNIYGNSVENKNLAVPEKPLRRALASNVSLINLTIEGEKEVRPAIVKEIQRDPVSGNLWHVDFLQVDLNEPVTTMVGVVLTGEDHRKNDGGIIEHAMREIQVTCLPTIIPDFISVDVSGLKVHDTLHVGDLKMPEGVQAETDSAEVVVSIVAPTLEPTGDEAEEDMGEAGEAAPEAEE